FMWYYKGNVLLSSYSGSFDADDCQAFKAPKWKEVKGISDPVKEEPEPVMKPEWTTNPTLSPDKKFVAFTRDGDLYVAPYEGKGETRLTFDGSKTVYNGYASWVYYEEIFGRPSKYRAFWWSPDSRKIAFYRFDDTKVPMFPIYSPKGQDGELRETHYPKAGETNPEVKIGIIDLDNIFAGIVWVDFDPTEDQYFGTPFWGKDSRTLFVAREPRIQRSIDLYSVNVADGSKKAIYHETYPTWVDWIENPYLDDKGIYMVRNCETGWDQAWFLSYDGSVCKRLTDGPNWRISLVAAHKDGRVFFLAERDSRVSRALYSCDSKGRISALTDVSLNVDDVEFSPDREHFVARLSGLDTPPKLGLYSSRKARLLNGIEAESLPEGLPKRELVWIENEGLRLPGIMIYPQDFNPSEQYPVHVDIYGGPDTPLVRGRWINPRSYEWYASNGIICLVADCRAAGHNGREGLDAIYRRLGTAERRDFIAWARWLQDLPYVKADKIGVEGFSFGGTMTTLLVATASEYYHYGLAGGGVYDWRLYDSHYTERYMDTPEANPEGYREASVLEHIGKYPVKAGKADGSVMLRLTHGSGDDNVHFQNSLQLIDALQRQGAEFEFMVYPDGMHGYRGYQGKHFEQSKRAFWLDCLKTERP
ncbi:MAG: DPP IV N-terminal domain-containing protein, partial [Bacteroidales bacterium]|nr:DPP IV N-terminal domain-containing protein [Bacteroidales bacterium]